MPKRARRFDQPRMICPHCGRRIRKDSATQHAAYSSEEKKEDKGYPPPDASIQAEAVEAKRES